MPPQRPLGVSIIAILSGLAGLVFIVGGIGIIALAGAGALVGYGLLAALGAALGVIVLVLGLVTLAVAIGLWRMRSWAWWLAFIVNLISVIVSIASFNWFGLIFPLIIVIYLVVIRDKFGIGGRPAGM